jgi:hypothetical protein
MDMKHGRLYVSISLIAYIAVLATLALLFNLAEKKAQADIDLDFKSLGQLTASAHDMGGGFSSQAFTQQMLERYQGTSALQCLLIQSADGTTRFCLPADSAYLETPAENPGEISLARKDALKVPELTSAALRQQSIALADGSSIRLSAAYTLITRKDLTAILLWGLALTMGALLVHLLILTRSPKKAEAAGAESEPPEEDFPSIPEAEEAPPYFAKSDDDEFTVPDFNFPSETGPAYSGEEAEIQDAVIHLKPFGEAPAHSDEPLEAQEPAVAYNRSQPAVAYNRSQPAVAYNNTQPAATYGDASPLDTDFAEPSGEVEPETGAPAKAALPSLFSAESGICLEAFLQERLTYELLRADHRGVDCALIFIGKDGSMSEAEYASNARLLTDFFISKDLVFERSGGQYAIILPGTDIDAAFSEAVKYLRMARELAESETGPNPWYMGISARGDREVDSSRLLAEAANALEKAKAGTGSRIVGFKADPELFKKYMREKA